MAKKFVLRTFKPGKKEHNKVNTLINLSALGLNSQQSIIKNSIALGAAEMNQYTNTSQMLYPYEDSLQDTNFTKYTDITKNSSESYAYYDLTYPQRVEYLRMFSQQPMINSVLDTVADEAIVIDENNYFAHLDTDKLKMNISANNELGEQLIDTCDKAFKRVYSMYGWDKSNGAWNMFKKFLIEGYLSFEIIYNSLENPTEIVGFKYIDPATLEPSIEFDGDGREIKVWYQNKGDSNERCIPDTNIVYISWSGGILGESYARISYLEGLTRTYNMLSQMENSRLIWNIQNAQKRVKIVVPVGDLSPYKAQALMNQLKADWNEDTHIDEVSGQLVVNGTPNFSFTKTYFFPQRTSGTITLEEIGTEGYDMSSIEPLKYFWRRFILETKVPANRFMIDPSADGSHPLGGDDASITREEYAFNRFINRVRSIFREILLKPVWIQICLYLPKLSKSEYLKQAIGIVYNEENSIVQAKERASIKQGIEMITQLYQLQDMSQRPIFSMKFLVQKYLNFTDDDMALNEKYKQEEILEQLDKAKLMKDHALYNAQNGTGVAPMPNEEGGGDFGGADFGGAADFGGGGADFGGGMEDFGGEAGGGADFGGGEETGGEAEM